MTNTPPVFAKPHVSEVEAIQRSKTLRWIASAASRLAMTKRGVCLAMTGLWVAPLFATDLMDVYKESLANDPIFKAAFSTYMSSTEAIPQARAALLPQIGLTSQLARANTGADIPGFDVDTNFNITQWQVSAQQAIFNFAAWKRVEKAKAAVKAAQADFNDAAQNLMLRVTAAYLDVLFAQDTLNFAEAKKRANLRQFEQANERFKVGYDAITSMYEAKAALDQSIADVIAAKNNQINQNEKLRKLTNQVYAYLSPLRDARVPLVRPVPNQPEAWISIGLKQNYALLAKKYKLLAARENIKEKQAGNWPVFSLQGSYEKTKNDGGVSSFFVPTALENSAISVNMNFPVYQGGLVASQTRQAQYDFQTTNENLEQHYRDVVVNARIAFNSIVDGISKVEADRQTVTSRLNQLDSTAGQYTAGTRTMVDVTNAQQRLFEAQEQLAKDGYALIKTQVQLKYLAGTLNANDLEEINAWLATTRINRFPPHRTT